MLGLSSVRHSVTPSFFSITHTHSFVRRWLHAELGYNLEMGVWTWVYLPRNRSAFYILLRGGDVRAFTVPSFHPPISNAYATIGCTIATSLRFPRPPHEAFA